jgi:hypothetical protein
MLVSHGHHHWMQQDPKNLLIILLAMPYLCISTSLLTPGYGFS